MGKRPLWKDSVPAEVSGALAGAVAHVERTTPIDFAIDLIAEDRDVLYALAVALENRLQPRDLANSADDANMIEWRLAQMLVARLESTKLMNDVRGLLRPGAAGLVSNPGAPRAVGE